MRGADTSEPCQDLEDKRDLGAPSPAVSADNQWKDKRVESPSWLCLDGGSTPPISTDRKRPSSYAGGLFLSVEIRACGAGASPSQPQSASLTAPFRGMRPAPSAPAGGFAASTSLRKSRSRSATAADAAFGLRPQNGVPILYPIF